MKKLLFLIAFILVGIKANAQFGVRAGANISNLSPSNYSFRGGFNLGAFYLYEWDDNLGFEFGGYFNQKGYNDKNNSGVTESFNYLSVPFLARYSFAQKFNVFIGPQASILVSRKRTNPDSSISKTTDIIRGYDLSALIGVGMELPNSFDIQIAYDYGLIGLNYFDLNVKNRTFQLSVAKRF